MTALVAANVDPTSPAARAGVQRGWRCARMVKVPCSWIAMVNAYTRMVPGPTHAHAHAQAHAHMLNVKCMSLADFFSFMGPRAGLETIEAVTALPREGGERILIFESPLYNVESPPADSRKRRPSGWVCCPECHGATCCKCAEMGRVWQSTCGEAVQLMWPALSQPYISTNDRHGVLRSKHTLCADFKSAFPLRFSRDNIHGD